MGPGIVSRLAGAILLVHRSTLRVERIHFDRYLGVRARGVPVICALWHGRMFVSIQAHRHEGVVTMASKSKDGEIIARWLERNGYSVVRGSSTRGGAGAFRAMLRSLRSGKNAALTVDGPLGPPRVVQPGIVELARMTGAWILPITYSSTRPRFLSSWDRYLVPMPFSRNFVVYGEAFAIDKDEPDDRARERIAAALDDATREADGVAGITPPDVWTAKIGTDLFSGRTREK